MPNLNQKGPMGEGSMTGRKMGKCTNFGAGRSTQTTPENENTEQPIADNMSGQGMGRGLGRGAGRDIGQNRGGGGKGRCCNGGRGMGMDRQGGTLNDI